jgi:PAS domain S-box-containing protein
MVPLLPPLHGAPSVLICCPAGAVPARMQGRSTNRGAGTRPTELRDLDRLYRLLVESVRDYAIFTLDPGGHVMSWNPGAERFKGYVAEEIIGRHFSAFYPPETRDTLPPLELEIATREGRVEDEGWRVRKDGSRFWANVVITALREEGRLVGFAKVTRDLTERKLSEERAREDAKRLAAADAANRAKTEFLTALSHELRTPLNAIAGYVDLLSAGVHGPLTELQLHDLQRVRYSQQHLLGLINDLLYYSRIEGGAIKYEVGDVDVAVVVDNVVALVGPQAAVSGIEIQLEAPDSPASVSADPSKLEQILINLLTNALKHSPIGSTVRVVWGAESGTVELSVIDEGTGIPEDKLEDIFEPFVQVGRTFTSSHEGTGLGLSISRDLARAMNGDIVVRSSLGHGATFTITLPEAQPRTT